MKNNFRWYKTEWHQKAVKALQLAGKGCRDRYIPLPKSTLLLLRKYWKTHSNKKLIFPALGRGHVTREGLHGRRWSAAELEIKFEMVVKWGWL